MRIRAKVIGLVFLANLGGVANVFAAPTLASGTDPTATLKGAVRYRNLISSSGTGGAKEVYVGLNPLDTSSPATADVA